MVGFLNEYDFGLNYHPNKANVVANDLSRKSLHMATLMVRKLDLIEQFIYLSLVCKLTMDSVESGMLKLTNGFLDEIRESQKLDVSLVDRLSSTNEDEYFRVDENGILKFQDRVCVPDVPELKKITLEKRHRCSLSIHPGAINMYQDLEKMFWWLGMKRDVAQFSYSCLTCQNLKIEHQKSYGLMHPLDIIEWKWDIYINDFCD